MGKLGRLKGNIAVAAERTAVPMSAESASVVEQLYRMHARDLCRYIAARFGLGPPEPEEVAQVAFTRLAASFDVNQVENPRSYLFTIACNIVLDHRRRAIHHGTAEHPWSAEGAEEAVSELSPERVLLGQERVAVFEKALRAMPAMRRRIFLLARAEGLSAGSIAERFGISENAVHKHISRALQDCAGCLDQANLPSGRGR